MLSEIGELWRSIDDLCVAPTSVTKAALIDALAEAKRKVLNIHQNPAFLEFNSLLVLSGELSTLIPQWDAEFMSALTDIYDCNIYDESRRTGNRRTKIDKPQLNILAGSTPDHVNFLLPDQAWGQGFCSRVIFIYSGEKKIIDPFQSAHVYEPRDFVQDLKSIVKLQGEMKFTPAAVDLFRAWHFDGNKPVPSHSKLASYNTRRWTHVLKLCMVSSISRDSDLTINDGDVAIALDWLLDAEKFMPDIFLAVTAGGDSQVIEDAMTFVWIQFAKNKEPVAEHSLVDFIRRRVPSHSVMQVLGTMVRSRMVEAVPGPYGLAYRPIPKL